MHYIAVDKQALSAAYLCVVRFLNYRGIAMHKAAKDALNNRPCKVREVAEAGGWSPSHIYGAVTRGEIRAVKVGRAIRIPAAETQAVARPRRRQRGRVTEAAEKPARGEGRPGRALDVSPGWLTFRGLRQAPGESRREARMSSLPAAASLEFHELANIFPLLGEAEFSALAEDIRAHGVREPVVLYEGRVLDGRNRYLASIAAGVDCPLTQFTGSDPAAFVVSLNLHRRHLSEGQRGLVAARLATLTRGRPSGEKQANLPVSQAEAADLLNVSERTVRTAAVVRDQAVPELIEKVERGNVSVSAAADVARLPESEQRVLVARGEFEILQAAKAIRAQKAEQRRAELIAVAARKAALPDGKFGTIVLDPPWPMQKIERDVTPEQVAFDYPTMTEAELEAFGCSVADMAADDCHLFVWTTQRFLPMALRLIEQYGFRYVLTMVWHKAGGFQPFGLPQYNCEFVVYARRGAPVFVDTTAFPCCFTGERREHSRKPTEF